MSRNGKVGIGVVIALVLLTLFVGLPLMFHGYASASAGETCVVRTGGWFQDQNISDVIPEGKNRQRIGWGSATYCYPTTQRSYIMGGPGQDADALVVLFKGGNEQAEEDQVRLTVSSQMYFTLNTKKDTLIKFHKNIGIKTKAYTSEGWVQEFLPKYIHPQIERAIEITALEFTAEDVLNDAAQRRAFEVAVQERIRERIDAQVGKDFICGPNFTGTGECGEFTVSIGRPDVTNTAIVESREQQQIERNLTQAQEEENRRLQSVLDFEQGLIEQYGPEGALTWKAINKGGITFWVLPDGTTVAPPAPAPTTEPGG